ncbi:MAG: glutamine synthetase III [Peptoniphilus sp.]|nr:glutamine synthetase III [Peptoniphilus sp.]MDD7363087.1 glutamine synthetase III [Bacillota bacterium]MDY6044415.1 glutamine synthetase III [Peptoniphilus sp.]
MDHDIKFGEMAFNKQMMRQRLPHAIYYRWKNAIRNEAPLDRETADAIAHAMKEWAIEKGATHYCHWFQPLNGLTAKKHDAFLDRTEKYDAIYRFSGKELIRGESDGSSFPTGGMRSTFEARGYTYWDATANSFIIDRILYIPTIFVSFNGDKLDKKGPLLESMKLLSDSGSRVVNLFEKDEYTYRMKPKVGLEQEFFLVDKTQYDARSDLKSVGRTLIGAGAPKGQELGDHYLGGIPARVMDFYEDVNQTLWELGIFAKTEHNEVAPGQFEIVALYENANIAVDYNQLIMSILKETARRHDMVCLLHEKPFAGVNGSGKHSNFSLTTNYGKNVFDPGDDPKENITFLLFLAATIEAVDDYAPLLRIASGGPSNDDRLGGLEAPPVIISMFLGEDLEEILKDIAYEEYHAKVKKPREIKINSLGYTPTDSSDRNRTSPFAFTGNKFEFRMVGSSMTGADANTVINTALGHSLRKIADRLEPLGDDEEALRQEAYRIVSEIVVEHERILYSKDNYSREWLEEAKKRGLPYYPTFFESLEALKDKELMRIFDEYGVLSENEVEAIYEIGMESVSVYHFLEARTLMTMLSKDVEPAVVAELNDILNVTERLENPALVDRLETLNVLMTELLMRHKRLKAAYAKGKTLSGYERARYFQEEITTQFPHIRKICDELESRVSRKHWTIPTYEDIFTRLI